MMNHCPRTCVRHYYFLVPRIGDWGGQVVGVVASLDEQEARVEAMRRLFGSTNQEGREWSGLGLERIYE